LPGGTTLKFWKAFWAHLRSLYLSEFLSTALRKLLYENAGLESVGIPVSGTHE